MVQWHDDKNTIVPTPYLQSGPSNLWIMTISNFKKQSSRYENWVKRGTEVCRGQTAEEDVTWRATIHVWVIGREMGQVQIVHGTLLWEGVIILGQFPAIELVNEFIDAPSYSVVKDKNIFIWSVIGNGVSHT
jgi:hypothetical protein